MKTYNKRVAMVVSTHHLIPNGGIGVGCQSIVDMYNQAGVVCDVILDRAPTDDLFADWFRQRGQVIYNEKPMVRKPWADVFAFSDGICAEEQVDLRHSLMKALKTNLYDLFVCHSPSAALAVYSLDLPFYVPTVVYTHDFNSVFKSASGTNGGGYYTNSVTNFNNLIYQLPGLICGTHTQRNLRELNLKDARCLPLPLSAPDLLDTHSEEQKGVLYVGRWEPRKAPQKFVSLIQQTGLPAKIITNARGKSKFQQEFARKNVDAGLVEYAIDCFDSGRDYLDYKEKAEYIKKCRVAYMPYLYESYGLTVYESLTNMPVVVPRTSVWGENFVEFSEFYWEDVDTCAERVLELYNRNQVTNNKQQIADKEQLISNSWMELLSLQVAPPTNSKARITEQDDIFLRDAVRMLGRIMCIEDVQSFYRSRNKFSITYTDTDTWLSKSNNPVPDNKEIILDANSLQNWFNQL